MSTGELSKISMFLLTLSFCLTASISVQPPSMLRGKTIEEIVNKWSSDLETHVKEFSRLAGEIAVWDRALIDNGNTVCIIAFKSFLLADDLSISLLLCSNTLRLPSVSNLTSSKTSN